uniref:Uncharacterized protein n=1 Tax=Moniliophthora roreri TaxID=221103 RepID=A0A0W0F6U9_MONRR
MPICRLSCQLKSLMLLLVQASLGALSVTLLAQQRQQLNTAMT